MSSWPMTTIPTSPGATSSASARASWSASSNQQHGQPNRVYSNTHVVSNGEKAVFALFWKNGAEFVGVKYIVLPNAEQMSLSFDANNLCYPTPRL